MIASEPLHILLIEDDPDTRANLADILELDGHRLTEAGSFAEAVEGANWADISTVILDRRLPDGAADEFLPRIHRLAPHAPVVVVTGYPDIAGAIEALRQGAYDYILKPLNPDVLLATLRRITRHVQTERALRESEEQRRLLAAAVRNLGEGVIITDAQLERPGPRIVFVNEATCRITGYGVEELVGHSPRLLQGPETDRAALVRLKQTLARGGTFEGQVINRRKDGSSYHVELVISPVRNGDGNVTHYVAIHRDVTELKQAERRSMQAARLAAIGQMVAGLAHENRNALQRSQACLEMLSLELEDCPDALDLVARIQRAQDDLHRLYDEVRNYAAPINLRPAACDIAQVWRDAWSHLHATHQAKKIEFHEHLGCHNRICIADPFALGQVFRNLFENAIAACPENGRVEVGCDNAQGHQPALKITIGDNGPGIAPEMRQKVFEPFFTTKTKGTGLGMAIARRIVEEGHGGRIEIGARRDRGAEVVIILPRGEP